jgi:hypothetical protein
LGQNADLSLVGVATVTVGLNAVLLYLAAADRSWGAVAIAITIAPIANLVVATVSLLFTPIVRRYLGVSAVIHVGISLGLPLLGALATYVLILSMDLHGS